jgi:hypothetical protein
MVEGAIAIHEIEGVGIDDPAEGVLDAGGRDARIQAGEGVTEPAGEVGDLERLALCEQFTGGQSGTESDGPAEITKPPEGDLFNFGFRELSHFRTLPVNPPR